MTFWMRLLGVGAIALAMVGACDEADKKKTADDKIESNDKKDTKDDETKTSTTPTSTNPAAVKMASFADIVCKCADATCAKAAHTSYASWVAGFSAAAAKMEKADFDAWTASQARLLGCWKKHADTKVAVALDMNKAADVITKVKGFVDQMCACKDKECADKVNTESKQQLKDVPPSVVKTITDEVDRHYKRFKECRDKAGEHRDTAATGNMDKFADDMCACADNACASGVQKRMMTWIKDYFKGGKKKGSKAQVERWKKSQKRFMECYVAKMKTGVTKPLTPPDPPAGGGSFAARLDQYVKDVCACSTSMCASQAARKHSKWLSEQAKQGFGANTQAAMQKLATASKQVMECMKRTMGR